MDTASQTKIESSDMIATVDTTSSFESKTTIETTTENPKKGGKTVKKKCWKKPKDKPKRPLSAYNLFFQHERERILAELGTNDDEPPKGGRRRSHRRSHGKIGFAALARNIAEKWKTIEACDKTVFEEQAAIEKTRYKIELDKWNQTQRAATNKVTPQIPLPMSLQQSLIQNNNRHMPLQSNNNIMINNINNNQNNSIFGNTFFSETTLSFNNFNMANQLYNNSYNNITKIDQLQQPMDAFKSSFDQLISNLDDECIDFLSQI